jgi:hypothetical protein
MAGRAVVAREMLGSIPTTSPVSSSGEEASRAVGDREVAGSIPVCSTRR